MYKKKIFAQSYLSFTLNPVEHRRNSLIKSKPQIRTDDYGLCPLPLCMCYILYRPTYLSIFILRQTMNNKTNTKLMC